MVTERTTEADRPAIKANEKRLVKMRHNFKNEPFLVFGMGWSIKFKNKKIKPTCKPETDKI